jgi:hypothetical protein
MNIIERIISVLNASKDVINEELKYLPFRFYIRRNIKVTRYGVQTGLLDRSLMVNYRKSVRDIRDAVHAVRTRDIDGMLAMNDTFHTIPQKQSMPTELAAVYSHTGFRIVNSLHHEARKVAWRDFKKSIGFKNG